MIIIPAAAAPPRISTSLEKSPERKKEMTTKVTKKISAVPKSPIMPRAAKQIPEKTTYSVRLPFSKSSSRVAAPAKTKASFTSSEGCTERPPMDTQFRAP